MTTSNDSNTRASTSVSSYIHPNSEKIQQLLDRTGYTLTICQGQHKYGGPPPDWVGPKPEKSCELLCSNIPFNMYEDVLVPLFEECGPIWELRLLMDTITNMSKGFAYITFQSQEGAKQALLLLDNYPITPCKRLQLQHNLQNKRIFVGNIPKELEETELEVEFKRVTPGLSKVIIYSSPEENKANRGYCFLDYNELKNASYARQRLSGLNLFGSNIVVNWADPEVEPDSDVMATVKILFVRNLSNDIDEHKLRRTFAPFGEIEHVKRMKNFGFVHFCDRDSAIQAMSTLNDTKLNGWKIEVSLAKPKLDQTKKDAISKQKEKRRLQNTIQVGSIGRPGPSGTQPSITSNSSSTDYGYSGYDGNRNNQYGAGGEYANRGNEFGVDRGINNNRHNETSGDRGVHDNRREEYGSEQGASGFRRSDYRGRDESGSQNSGTEDRRSESGYRNRSTEYRVGSIGRPGPSGTQPSITSNSSSTDYGYSGYDGNRNNQYGAGGEYANRGNEFGVDRGINNNRHNETSGDRGIHDNRREEYGSEQGASGFRRSDYRGRDESGPQNSGTEDRRSESGYRNRSTEYRGNLTGSPSSGYASAGRGCSWNSNWRVERGNDSDRNRVQSGNRNDRSEYRSSAQSGHGNRSGHNEDENWRLR